MLDLALNISILPLESLISEQKYHFYSATCLHVSCHSSKKFVLETITFKFIKRECKLNYPQLSDLCFHAVSFLSLTFSLIWEIEPEWK